MTRTLGADGVVELAVVERSGFEEARHLGAAVLTDRGGVPVRGLGDVDALVFPRSSLKPFQAIAALRAGADLRGEQLALAQASHAGTPEHVRVVRDILAGAGLDEGALRCAADWPLDQASRDDLVRSGGAPRPVTMTCSGKHAGMLAACVASGWSTPDYVDPAHPLQVAILDLVEEFTGAPVEASGVDGCGAPVHATSLAGVARAMSSVAIGDDPRGAAVFAAALEHPWAVDGPGRPNTIVMQELGVFAKSGAEGFMLMAARTGETVAVKVIDGGMRAGTLIALELLAQGGVISRSDADRVAPLATPAITGGNQVIGSIRTTF